MLGKDLPSKACQSIRNHTIFRGFVEIPDHDPRDMSRQVEGTAPAVHIDGGTYPANSKQFSAQTPSNGESMEVSLGAQEADFDPIRPQYIE